MTVRFALLWWLALSLFVLIVFLGGRAESADPNPPLASQQNPDQFQYQGVSLDIHNPHSKALRESGEWRWRYERNPSCPDLRRYVELALQDLSNTFAIDFREDPLNGNLIYANCGPAIAAVCGGAGFSCLGRGYPRNVTIDLNGELASYFEVTAVSITLHELLHAMCTWHEQYVLGTFAPSQDVTVMNTGPLSRHYLLVAERDRWNRTCGPVSLKVVGQDRHPDGTPYVFFCNPPERTTRVALLYDDGSGLYWTGKYAEPGVDPNGCRGMLVEERPGRTVYLKSESAVSWRTSFTEVVAGRY